jgi:hypothetical protein
VDFVIFVINIDLISDRCECAIRLKNELVLLLIFNLTLFRNPFLENQFFKIDILKTTKGNLKKEP